MRTILPLCLILIAFLFQNCKTDLLPSEVETAINAVKEQYAPDKRVALFNIEASKDGKTIELNGETNLPEAKEELLSLLADTDFLIKDQIELLPAKDLEDHHYGVVRLSACNIRSKPGNSQELATQSTMGTSLKVLKKDGDWFLVQTPDHYLGWLDDDGFAPMTEAELRDWEQLDKVVYIPDFGFSYQGIETGAPRVSDLLAGNILGLEKIEQGYAKVIYPDGRKAYVPANEVMDWEDWLLTREANAENILASAMDFMGRPYLWGGTSGKGVDCSGFTKTVFYLNGVLLARDASQQVHTGIEVQTDTTWANLQAGDLLFFGTPKTDKKKERITHVAIYMGDGKIIHSAGIVKIESLRRGDPDFAEHRFNSFIRAKRMLSSLGENGVGMLAESPFYNKLN